VTFLKIPTGRARAPTVMTDKSDHPASMWRSSWPYVALTLSMLFFASNHILGRLIPGEVPPIGLSFWRWVVATLVILPFTWKELVRETPLIIEHWKILVLLTVFLVILGNTTVYIALQYTTAINAGIVAMTQPAVTILLTWIFFREAVTKSQAIGALIAGGGVLIIIVRGDIQALTNVEFNAGDLWMVVSVLGFTSYAVFLRSAPKGLSNMVLLNILQFLGIIVLLPFYVWETVEVMPMQLNTTTVISVLWAGIIVAVAALWLWIIGNREVGANKASAFVYLRLLMITVMAMVILDETLELYHAPSFVMIIVGVYLVSKANRSQ